MNLVTLLPCYHRSTYPGYSSGHGYIENLSHYIEDGRPLSKQDPDVLIAEGLVFDIERLVSWDKEYNLEPFQYSMMIDGYYPLSFWPWLRKKSHPTKEEFVEIASQLPDFAIDEEISNRREVPQYRNSDNNIFINYRLFTSNSILKRGRDQICIGVIRKEPTSDLDTITNEIVPYAVELFNQLSPTRKLDKDIVEKSIKFAHENDKILPKRIINGKLRPQKRIESNPKNIT
ncbi:MAG: hypothetical protein KAS11_02675 [Candidatus Aenigmarchaeota archaeon]|nr:hypothetical protein [Candidatus Aenigmarchaeota archaeon]